MEVRNRIIEHRTVKASSLKAHPLNWRIHPDYQREVMIEVFQDIGSVDNPKVYIEGDDLVLFNGHLRTAIIGEDLDEGDVTDLTAD